jgi:hypothetical protein
MECMINSVIFYTEHGDGDGGGGGYGSSRILSFYIQWANITICNHYKAYMKHLAM